MSQLAITDLNYFDSVFPEKICLKGGTGISITGSLTPSISLAYDTAYDTRYATDYNVTGNQLSGFGVDLLSFGSGAGSASASTSIGGLANASANAKA